MHPEFYNPCQDGFPAKVWECLRRNEEFKAAFKDIAEAPNSEDRLLKYEALKYLAERDEEENYYADVVLSWLSVDPALDLGKTWPQLPVALQEQLASKFRLSKPRPWIGPTLSACYSGDGFDLDKASRKLVMAENFLRHYRTIAVPRFIRDSEHRKTILAEIRKLIPKASRDARHLKPTGRILGTNAEWNAFLLTETWRAKGCSLQQAANLATWEIYRRGSFLKCSEGFLLSAEGKGQAQKKAQQRGAKVVEEVRTIERQIHRAFPKFMPFAT
jgi:hypothetical protein